MAEDASGRTTRGRWILRLAIPGALVVIGVMAFAIFEPIQVLPRIRLGPGFSLTDQAGAPFTSEDVRGDIVLYSFGYDDCGDRCAGMESTVTEVRDRLGEVDLGDVDIRFVTISLDPASEGPDELTRQALRVSADGEQWRYVSGDPDHVENVIRAGFRTWYEPRDDGSVAFDPALILVDGWGVIRGEYRYQTVASDADKIIRHLDVLGEELRNATGAATVAYEAAHFFLCYP
ncbi:MAG: SCO family protein [Acidimicrobiia bacterium]|nr:SCO family protein [Acidimicrobiia bacterium]